MKNISFLSENFQFLKVKFSIYLNRRVFVMKFAKTSKIADMTIYGKSFNNFRNC